jgi:hypothetical protein
VPARTVRSTPPHVRSTSPASSNSPRSAAAFSSARSACAAASRARCSVAFASGIAAGYGLSVTPVSLRHRRSVSGLSGSPAAAIEPFRASEDGLADGWWGLLQGARATFVLLVSNVSHERQSFL